MVQTKIWQMTLFQNLILFVNNYGNLQEMLVMASLCLYVFFLHVKSHSNWPYAKHKCVWPRCFDVCFPSVHLSFSSCSRTLFLLNIHTGKSHMKTSPGNEAATNVCLLYVPLWMFREYVSASDEKCGMWRHPVGKIIPVFHFVSWE
jgi:hypothetical protein